MNTITALAESVGLIFDREPVADGKIHYAKTIDDKPGKLSGRYVIRPQSNNFVFAWLMNHKTGKQVKQWISDKVLKEKFKVIDPVFQADADEYDNMIKQKTIKEKWESAEKSLSNHKYLVAKRIGIHGARQDNKGRLVIPVRDVISGELKGLQYISPNGTKKFEPGTKQKGNGILLGSGSVTNTLFFIAEGFATAATIREVFPATVIAALCCNNIFNVVKALRLTSPVYGIIICADNDQFTEGNPGIRHAIEAASLCNAKFIYPEFKEEHLVQKPTDFNDFARLYGKEELRRFINERIQGRG